MKNSTLIAAVMLLSLVFVCFISAPVFSAEDPWDVDNGNDNSGSTPESDSTVIDEDVMFYVNDGDDSSSGWFTEFVFKLSYVIATYCVDEDNQQSSTSVVTAEKPDADSAVR
ncbi:MAG: hypothetical protein U9R56_00610 [candidate division Zixibacteria bacterium]|nr:hypothetical protein [candidate division Zixibacteria bacterium]